LVDILALASYNKALKAERSNNYMKVQNDVRVTIRVDKSLKARAETLFEQMGLNMSTALNVFLRKAVDESAIPFAVSVKSMGFAHGYSASDITSAFNAVVKNECAENLRQGFPVARYDAEKRQAFLEVADGTREYVSG
jgi:addiction module RelB/DinJ family antitoxin